MTRTPKQRLTDLAIFGGRPAFPEPRHVGRPNIGDRQRFLERVNDILDRRWLTNNGPYVQELERRLADRIGVKHCIPIANGTVALEIVIRALGLSGEVIVPSMTFIATAHALRWLGITPVFCDIAPRTYTLDPNQVETLITPRTTGILGVHLWGHPCEVDRLAGIAHRHNLKLVFDAAHAFGCSYNGRMIGSFGDAEVFSFHATKFFNTFEGGAISTNDDLVAREARLMHNFGFAGYDNVVRLGINGKMNEFSAAMGLTSLDAMDDFIEQNHRHFEQYERELTGIPGLHVIGFDGQEQHNYQYVVIEVDPARAGLTRDQVFAVCWAERILARRYFYPACHQMEPYRSERPGLRGALPITERTAERVLALPTGTAMTSADVSGVCELLGFVVSHASEITAALPSDDTRHPADVPAGALNPVLQASRA